MLVMTSGLSSKFAAGMNFLFMHESKNQRHYEQITN
jgi:hypothetical protein